MKCDICDVREATVHLTEVVDDEVTKLYLCEQCAKTKSHEMHSHFGLSDLLSGLVDMGASMTGDMVQENVALKCPTCGMTYYDFQKTGMLGCGKCYDTFRKNLSELLRKIHGSDKHVGKMPLKGNTSRKAGEDMQRLKNELESLVRVEEFEKAALLRDRIRDLNEKLDGGTEDNEDR